MYADGELFRVLVPGHEPDGVTELDPVSHPRLLNSTLNRLRVSIIKENRVMFLERKH